jgi:hypothetical protein
MKRINLLGYNVVYSASEEHFASIFRVEELAEKETSVKAGGKQTQQYSVNSQLLQKKKVKNKKKICAELMLLDACASTARLLAVPEILKNIIDQAFSKFGHSPCITYQ